MVGFHRFLYVYQRVAGDFRLFSCHDFFRAPGDHTARGHPDETPKGGGLYPFLGSF
jgi:hypothetical protein